MNTVINAEGSIPKFPLPMPPVNFDKDMATFITSPTWDPTLLDMNWPEVEPPFASLSQEAATMTVPQESGSSHNVGLTALDGCIGSPLAGKHPSISSMDQPVLSIEHDSSPQPNTSEGAELSPTQSSLLLTQPISQMMGYTHTTNAPMTGEAGHEFHRSAFKWATSTALNNTETMTSVDWTLPANSAVPSYMFEPNTGGRRRPCSMPPEPLPTFHRTMANGAAVNISRPIARGTVARRELWRDQRPTSQMSRPPILRSYTTMPTTHTNGSTHEVWPASSGFVTPNRDMLFQRPVSAADSARRGRPAKRQRISTRGHPEASSTNSSIQYYTAPLISQFDLLKDLMVRAMEDYKTVQLDELEIIRARQRAHNRSLTDMHAPLEILEGLSREDQWVDIPQTGLAIRAARQQAMSAVLEAYGIPFVSTMFLFEKKLLYMQFVGASQPFMHLVLDHID